MKPPASRGERGNLLSVKISHKNHSRNTHTIESLNKNSLNKYSLNKYLLNKYSLTQESLNKNSLNNSLKKLINELIKKLSTNCTLSAAREGNGDCQALASCSQELLGFSPTLSCSRKSLLFFLLSRYHNRGRAPYIGHWSQLH